MMRGYVIAAYAVLSLSSNVFAQSALDLQQAKVNALTKEFLSASDAVETRIDEVVSALTALRDSPASGTKVADTKIEAIQSLKANVENYRTKRLKVEEQLRRPVSYWDPETLKKVEQFLDGKTQKRVDQIMELVNSVEGSAGSSEKPTVLREDGWGNFRQVEDTSSKEYKQDKKLDKRATQVQKETRETIEQRIVDIEDQIRTLKSQAASTVNATRKAELERQTTDYEARLAAAKDALSTIGEASYAGETRTVESSSEGHKLNMKLGDVAAQLQTEQRKVDALGAQLMNELATLDSLKASTGQP
jgi:hypothetical protein